MRLGSLFEKFPYLQSYLNAPYLIGVVILLFTGISIFGRPSYEISFSREILVGPCVHESCVTILTLRVGNTGTKVQDSVRVSVLADIDKKSIHGATVMNAAKIPKKFERDETEKFSTYSLASIEPGHRLDLSWTFVLPIGAMRPSWNQFGLELKARQGIVQEGHPEMTTFGRGMYQAASLF